MLIFGTGRTRQWQQVRSVFAMELAERNRTARHSVW